MIMSQEKKEYNGAGIFYHGVPSGFPYNVKYNMLHVRYDKQVDKKLCNTSKYYKARHYQNQNEVKTDIINTIRFFVLFNLINVCL